MTNLSGGHFNGYLSDIGKRTLSHPSILQVSPGFATHVSQLSQFHHASGTPSRPEYLATHCSYQDADERAGDSAFVTIDMSEEEFAKIAENILLVTSTYIECNENFLVSFRRCEVNVNIMRLVDRLASVMWNSLTFSNELHEF